MQTTLDEVVATVLGAREDGPEALAAVAMAFGSSMVLGALGNAAHKATIAELRAAQTAADEMVAQMRHELKQARESAADAAEVWRLREALDACRAERDRLGVLVVAAREERDRAVRERNAFGLRASAAEHDADRARAEARAYGEALTARDSAEIDALRDRPTGEVTP